MRDAKFHVQLLREPDVVLGAEPEPVTVMREMGKDRLHAGANELLVFRNALVVVDWIHIRIVRLSSSASLIVKFLIVRIVARYAVDFLSVKKFFKQGSVSAVANGKSMISKLVHLTDLNVCTFETPDFLFEVMIVIFNLQMVVKYVGQVLLVKAASQNEIKIKVCQLLPVEFAMYTVGDEGVLVKLLLAQFAGGNSHFYFLVVFAVINQDAQSLVATDDSVVSIDYYWFHVVELREALL